MFKTTLFAFSVLFVAETATAATLQHLFNFETDGNDNVGSATGSLQGGATISGGVLNLDGINDYLQISQNLLPIDGSDFTLAFQALNSRSSQSGIQEIISQGSSGGPGFYVGNDSGNIRFTDQFGAISEPTPTDGLFHDYVVSSETGVGTTFFLDGSQVFSSSTTLSIGGSTNTRFGTQFNFGAFPFDEYFQGQIDNVKVFDGALSSSEVATVFDDPNIVPLPAAGWLLMGGLGALFSIRNQNLKWQARRTAHAM